MGDEALLDPLRSEDRLAELLENRGTAVVYKHSPRCWQSFMAIGQVRSFALDHRDVPVHVVDVIADRPLSRLVADRLGVRHESPQVILVRDGVAVWDASHLGVRAGSIAAALEE